VQVLGRHSLQLGAVAVANRRTDVGGGLSVTRGAPEVAGALVPFGRLLELVRHG
jgi:hypothetical protein